MATVTRLVTIVDLDDGVSGPRSMSLSALHLAVLDGGRQLTLLDDRGWSQSGPGDVRQWTTTEDIADTARTVVGPDEPFDDLTHADMARDHWAALAATLQRQGVDISGEELGRLPHDVELGPRVGEGLGLSSDPRP